jgi:putative FmdB family regulatory protein
MPIYEYRCLECGHQFELMQKFSDPPLEQCPSCPGTVQKLISRSAFHLKGNGWYTTDYARKSSPNGTSQTERSAKSSDTAAAASDTASTPKDTAKATSTDAAAS